MKISRRHSLVSALFGAGYVGLRSLASGIPASILMNPRRALASGSPEAGLVSHGGPPPTCFSPTKAQYLILSTAGGGDPIGCNVPGTYDDPNNTVMTPMTFQTVGHPLQSTMAPTPLVVGGATYTAAQPWSLLSNWMNRTCFFHNATNTPVHTAEQAVLTVNGAIDPSEMLPSVIAKYTAPCLNTVQTQPVCLGLSPQEGIQFDGQNLPLLSAADLAQILTAPSGPLASLQAMRDRDLTSLNNLFKANGTAQQRAFLDQYATSQTQLRSIKQSLFQQLSVFTQPDKVADDLQAAVILIQMKLAPVFVVDLPFGGDNHEDNALADEAKQHASSLTALQGLMQALTTAGLQDQVTFASWNVFGRQMNTLNGDQGVGGQGVGGRDHNANHHCMIMIGSGVKGSVIGGIGPVAGDFGALPIQSSTGYGSPSGDVSVADGTALACAAKTLMVACGMDPAVSSDLIQASQPLSAALA